MSRIAVNIASVLDTVADAETRAGREPGSVTVVAVTKTRPAEDAQEALEHGIIHLGENRVQEAAAKISLVTVPAIWHLIGHLQSNKIRRAAGLFQCVESVDTPEVASSLAHAAVETGVSIDVLVQVNISGEVQKSGILPDRAASLASYMTELNGIRLRGLMTIGTFGANEHTSRTEFAQMRRLFEDIHSDLTGYAGFDQLSMGMSGDFKHAIEEGSTMVRIGTAIFGERG